MCLTELILFILKNQYGKAMIGYHQDQIFY